MSRKPTHHSIAANQTGQQHKIPGRPDKQYSRRQIIVVLTVSSLFCLVITAILIWKGFTWYISSIPMSIPIFIVLLYLGYTKGSKWTGFGGYDTISMVVETETASPLGKLTKTIMHQSGKTFWDWMQLLIIPAALALAAIAFNIQQNQTSLQLTVQQHQTDLQIAKDQQQETILESYLDRMADLLLNDKLRESRPGAEVRQVARARTLTALQNLDPRRKSSLLRFLYEANLISKNNVIISLYQADLRNVNLSDSILDNINLSGAILSNADLSNIGLRSADLSNTNLSDAKLTGAKLENVNLSQANLSQADLSQADLSFANLGSANLHRATLTLANLQSANLRLTKLDFAKCDHTDLSKADLNHAYAHYAYLNYAYLNYASLRYADLEYANLMNSYLNYADLNSTDLSHANLDMAHLSHADLRRTDLSGTSLSGTIMPDGSIHP